MASSQTTPPHPEEARSAVSKGGHQSWCCPPFETRPAAAPQGEVVCEGNAWSWHDQCCPEIVDVGLGRACDNAVTQHFEKAVPVIVVQHGLGVTAHGAGAQDRIGAEDAARYVLGAVDAVGIGGQPPDACRAICGNGLAQKIFDVAPAAALAAHRDRGLAAGQDHGGLASALGMLDRLSSVLSA